jgi:hypothetical protein
LLWFAQDVFVHLMPDGEGVGLYPELRLRLARGYPNWTPAGVELRSLTGCMRKLTHTVCVSLTGNHINRKKMHRHPANPVTLAVVEPHFHLISQTKQPQ